MTDDANCDECEEKQTSSHLFECILISSRRETKDIIGLTDEIIDEMIEIIEHWIKK